MCRFGYKGIDRNRYGQCVNCSHDICEDCKAYSVEIAEEMEAEDAATPSSDGTNWSPIPDQRGGTSDEDDGDLVTVN